MTLRQPRSVILEAAEGIAVHFDWHRDRFRQRLVRDGEGVAESVEGDADDLWPPAPPIQQLSLETIDGSKVLLGVGAAGRCHWSISVAVDPSMRGLKFDLACRSREVPGFIGSTYRLDNSVTLTPLDASEIFVPTDPDDRQSLRIEAVVPRQPSTQQTHRWAYQIEPRLVGAFAQRKA